MKIVLAFVLSLCVVALTGLAVKFIGPWAQTADIVFVGPVVCVIFACSIALAWAPWFLITRKG